MDNIYDAAHRELIDTLTRADALLKEGGPAHRFGFEWVRQEEEFVAALATLVNEVGIQLRVRQEPVPDAIQALELALQSAGEGLPDDSATCECGHSPTWHSPKKCRGKETSRDGSDDCDCDKRTAYTVDQVREIREPESEPNPFT